MNSHQKLVKLARYLLVGFLPTIIICAVLLFICPLTSSIYYPQDVRIIDTRYNQIYTALRNSDYETAYDCMSSTYHQAHSFEEFKDDYWFYTDDLYTLHPKHFIVFSGDTATLYPKSFDVLYAGPAYELVKVDGEWYFTGKSNFYLD